MRHVDYSPGEGSKICNHCENYCKEHRAINTIERDNPIKRKFHCTNDLKAKKKKLQQVSNLLLLLHSTN